MNNLTKEETVWLHAFTAATTCHLQAANYALEAFRVTFPPSPPPQKEGVYVTMEMLAKAWNEISPTAGDYYFKRLCQGLGLKP